MESYESSKLNKKQIHRMKNREKLKTERQIFSLINHKKITIRYKLRLKLNINNDNTNEYFHGAEVQIGYYARKLHFQPLLKLISNLENEEIGMMVLEYLVKSVIEDISSWGPNSKISIPVSVGMIRSVKFISVINELWQDSISKKSRFEFLIDEYDIVHGGEDAFSSVLNLYNEGIHIVLDGYGKHYGSIVLGTNDAFVGIKIGADTIFNRNILDRYKASETIRFINNILRERNGTLIVDDIETEEQLELVRAQRVPIAQGPWISPILTSEQIRSFMNA
jgi:EAL domain-containing protein (putative c-di-GMP-specific phosphodiesterase class I)